MKTNNTPKTEYTISIFFLYFLLFIEGFVSIAVEILTIRQLTPFVGSSVIVTSLIIGIFLLFLSFGYWRGGLYQNKFIPVLKKNFIWAALFIGFGLSYLFLDSFFNLANYLPTQNSLVILTLYLLVITAPMVYFLGQTIPITMNLAKKEKMVGTIGSKVLFLNTLGSFLGSVLTTLLLIDFLGVAATVFINFGLMIILVLYTISQTNKAFKYELLGSTFTFAALTVFVM